MQRRLTRRATGFIQVQAPRLGAAQKQLVTRESRGSIAGYKIDLSVASFSVDKQQGFGAKIRFFLLGASNSPGMINGNQTRLASICMGSGTPRLKATSWRHEHVRAGRRAAAPYYHRVSEPQPAPPSPPAPDCAHAYQKESLSKP